MLAAAGALALTAPAAAQAMPGTGGAVPAFCGGTGPIRAADLAAAVSLNGCELRGRLVVQSAGAAHIGVRVPPPGRAEGAEAATTSGDRVLVVSNTGGHVSATTSFRPVPAPAPADVTPATDPACNELAAAYLGFVWVETLNWFYNQSTVSRAGLDGPTTRDEIRQANRNITLGINNCGWSETGFGAFGAYQGTTDKFANINSAAECTSKFPDGQNTVSWGPFDSNEADTLALTCFEYDTGGNRFAIEADTYLGSNRRLVTSFSPFCSDSFDLQSVMTHEWGHSYGLDHVNAPHLVMYDFQSACALRRHLGEGDYAGMAHLYGLR
ncbi:MAG: matrixin family metalloprotease [Mycobacteriales bacterium]